MKQVDIQMGAGLYARVEPSIDGFITIQFGEMMGGMFFPVSEDAPQSVHTVFWDGNGWHPDIFLFVRELRKGQPTQSAILQAELNVIARRNRRELQALLRQANKTGEDWIRIARYVQQADYLSEDTLRQWQRQMPPIVRAVVSNKLAARTGG